jgi:hypothetical protein
MFRRRPRTTSRFELRIVGFDNSTGTNSWKSFLDAALDRAQGRVKPAGLCAARGAVVVEEFAIALLRPSDYR